MILNCTYFQGCYPINSAAFVVLLKAKVQATLKPPLLFGEVAEALLLTYINFLCDR